MRQFKCLSDIRANRAVSRGSRIHDLKKKYVKAALTRSCQRYHLCENTVPWQRWQEGFIDTLHRLKNRIMPLVFAILLSPMQNIGKKNLMPSFLRNQGMRAMKSCTTVGQWASQLRQWPVQLLVTLHHLGQWSRQSYHHPWRSHLCSTAVQYVYSPQLLKGN